jgi:hypothetical protein
MAADYASAMYAIRQLGDELVEAQSAGSDVETRRALHARIDAELARAITAASAIYERAFAAGGGMYRAEARPEVALWKRRLQTALTLRSQHQLQQIDDPGVVAPSSVRISNRAAYGPHQAGMDFDV